MIWSERPDQIVVFIPNQLQELLCLRFPQPAVSARHTVGVSVGLAIKRLECTSRCLDKQQTQRQSQLVWCGTGVSTIGNENCVSILQKNLSTAGDLFMLIIWILSIAVSVLPG